MENNEFICFYTKNNMTTVVRSTVYSPLKILYHILSYFVTY
nr:MAG TPA: hypothetical protein [Bacteriophage sp.]